MSEAHGFVNDKMFLYESTKLEDLLAKMAEKVPPRAFIQEFDFTAMLSVGWYSGHCRVTKCRYSDTPKWSVPDPGSASFPSSDSDSLPR